MCVKADFKSLMFIKPRGMTIMPSEVCGLAVKDGTLRSVTRKAMEF